MNSMYGGQFLIKNMDFLRQNGLCHSDALREKCPYFPVFRLTTDRYGISLRIQFICRYIQTRETLNTHTFHIVMHINVIMFLDEISIMIHIGSFINSLKPPMYRK